MSPGRCLPDDSSQPHRCFIIWNYRGEPRPPTPELLVPLRAQVEFRRGLCLLSVGQSCVFRRNTWSLSLLITNADHCRFVAKSHFYEFNPLVGTTRIMVLYYFHRIILSIDTEIVACVSHTGCNIVLIVVRRLSKKNTLWMILIEICRRESVARSFEGVDFTSASSPFCPALTYRAQRKVGSDFWIERKCWCEFSFSSRL